MPVATGELRSGITSTVYEDKNAIYGFVNFADGSKKDAIKVAAINYGRQTGDRGTTAGYDFIGVTKLLIAKRSANSIKRIVKKAVKDAMNG